MYYNFMCEALLQNPNDIRGKATSVPCTGSTIETVVNDKSILTHYKSGLETEFAG